MFGTIRTLMRGHAVRAEDRVRAAYSIELIDQKVREAQDGLKLAKATLASLIQRQRGEERQVAALEGRIADLTGRARDALAGAREDLAAEAAEAIAVMENELSLRRETRARLEARVVRLQASVEATHRRIIDLRQGAVAARALRDEHALQGRLNATLAGSDPMTEAEELIATVLRQDDPLEQAEILTGIERGLNREAVADRLAEAGFGRPMKSTAAQVLARLKSA